MHMHVDAARQARQHLEVEVVDVAAGLGHVRRVDEEDVVLRERGEQLEGHVLHRLRHDAGARLVSRQEQGAERLGEGIDEGALDGAAEEQVARVEHQTGGVARAHLDDAPRPRVAQHAVEEDAIRVGVLDVLEPVPLPFLPLRGERHLPVVLLELLEQGELALGVQVDGGQVTRRAVEDALLAPLHLGRIGNGRVEVARRPPGALALEFGFQLGDAPLEVSDSLVRVHAGLTPARAARNAGCRRLLRPGPRARRGRASRRPRAPRPRNRRAVRRSGAGRRAARAG